MEEGGYINWVVEIWNNGNDSKGESEVINSFNEALDIYNQCLNKYDHVELIEVCTFKTVVKAK